MRRVPSAEFSSYARIERNSHYPSREMASCSVKGGRSGDGFVRWLCNHHVDRGAAAVEWPIIRLTVSEVSGALDILGDRPVWQYRHGRSDRRRDHLIPARNRGVKGAATIEIGCTSDIDSGAG